MNTSNPELFALINDIIQAIIVIFGTAVVLYNSNRLRRAEVTRAFCLLVSFVVLVYLSELLVGRIVEPDSAETWLRIGWVGIALVPAAQFHLSSTLLATTGKLPHYRRFLVPAGYIVGIIFAALALWTDYLAADLVFLPYSARLSAGPLFPLFSLYFWFVAVSSIYNVWRARHRCMTSTTRRRMTNTLIAFLAAPLAVFPYMLLVGDPARAVPSWLWLVIIFGNLLVGVMFGVLTAELAYFGTVSPDRVVQCAFTSLWPGCQWQRR